jgi:hypothetical protein
VVVGFANSPIHRLIRLLLLITFYNDVPSDIYNSFTAPYSSKACHIKLSPARFFHSHLPITYTVVWYIRRILLGYSDSIPKRTTVARFQSTSLSHHNFYARTKKKDQSRTLTAILITKYPIFIPNKVLHTNTKIANANANANLEAISIASASIALALLS